jgi:resuscitation-promoting factor RpfB
MPLKPGYLILAGAGGIVAYSGIKGKSISSAIRDVLSGQSPKNALAANQILPANKAGIVTASGSKIDVAQAPSSISGNVALGKKMAAAIGWTGQQWNALYSLWQRESGWSNTAENPTSGAYGIAQALGHGPSNQYPAGPANPPTSSAVAQITWGLAYIRHVYGNPVNALAHEDAYGWY